MDNQLLLLASYYNLNVSGSKRIVVGFGLEDQYRTYEGVNFKTLLKLESASSRKCITFKRSDWTFVAVQLAKIESWMVKEEHEVDARTIDSHKILFGNISIQHVISYGKHAVKFVKHGNSITLQKETFQCLRR